MDLLQKDVPILAKIYEAKCFYDSQNNRIILYYKNHITARTLVDFYDLPTTPPPNNSLYIIYDLQTGIFNVSTDPPIYTVSNSKVYVTSPINAEYDMDKVIIYRISRYETDTDTDLNYILTQLNTLDNSVREQQANINYILTRLDTLDNFVHEQQTNTNYILTQLDTFVRKQQADIITATHTFDPTHPGPAFQLGPNAQNQLIRYLNADKVDGFNASQTPAPNTIPVALPTGKLDIGWLPDNIGGYRRVDLSNATSDYELQVGEEAIIRFTNIWNVPLRIATDSNRLYEIYIYSSRPVSSPYRLAPNNTYYSSSFSWMGITWHSNNSHYSRYSENNTQSFTMLAYSLSVVYAIIDTTSRIIQGFSGYKNADVTRYSEFVSAWYSNLVNWTSLGTLELGSSSTGYILVRRLV